MQYTTNKIPRARYGTLDVGRISSKRHSIAGFLEIDVTDARKNVRATRKTMSVSFNGWLIKTICDQLSLYKNVAAYAKGKRKIYIFEDINASVLIEKSVGATKVPLAMMIPHANRKTAGEITLEIEQARNRPLDDHETVINQKDNMAVRIYQHLPAYLRRKAMQYLAGSPLKAFNRMGNVVITSVGTMGKINGWFLQSTIHPVSIGLGSITEKPWVVDGAIKPRQILHMTASFDHDVVDGAEMARFTRSLVETIEKGEI